MLIEFFARELNTADEWVEEASQYNWDENDHQSDGGGHTYRTSVIRIPTQEDIPVRQVYGVRSTPVGKSLSNERSWQPRTVVAVDKMVEPLYHHRSHHHPTM